MSYHQIPTVVKNRQHVALNVITWTLSRQQVATPRIVPFRRERIAHDS
jgi:hypothetical protein